MFNIVLVAPEIPANTGNIGRTCVVTGSRLHLVGPLGFSLDERALRRAGLGYWESLDVTVYESWGEFVEKNGLAANDARLHLLTKKARRTYAEACYQDGDFLVFGCESVGLPEGPARRARRTLRAQSPCCRTPSRSRTRRAGARPGSATTQALLAQDVCGNLVNPEDYRISALNLSNAAAIVLYEALRQTGFAGM